MVGQIMDAIATAECDENTLVFFTSDNGAPPNHVAIQDARGSNVRCLYLKRRLHSRMLSDPTAVAAVAGVEARGRVTQ
jgi:arylsulfatase A-like enzyme